MMREHSMRRTVYATTGLGLMAALSLGCGAEVTEVEPTPLAPEQAVMSADPTQAYQAPGLPSTQLRVGTTLILERELEPGVSLGFDLDAHVSDRADPIGCRQGDFTSPDGTIGVDNQIARLVPLIEAAGGAALTGLVQSAINEGDMLVMIELIGVDSLTHDDDVTVRLTRGLGQPFVGTDDRIEPWQTYDLDLEAPTSTASATIRDGVLEAGPLEFELPIYVFDFSFALQLVNARMRLTFGDDGSASVMFGGSVSIQGMLDIVENIDGGQQLPPLIDTVGRQFADLEPDENGVCQSLSATVTSELVGAFWFADGPEHAPQPGEAP